MWPKVMGLYDAFSLNEIDHQIQLINGSDGPSAVP